MRATINHVVVVVAIIAVIGSGAVMAHTLSIESMETREIVNIGGAINSGTPAGITVGPDGNYYVVDADTTEQVDVFYPNGTYTGTSYDISTEADSENDIVYVESQNQFWIPDQDGSGGDYWIIYNETFQNPDTTNTIASNFPAGAWAGPNGTYVYIIDYDTSPPHVLRYYAANATLDQDLGTAGNFTADPDDMVWAHGNYYAVYDVDFGDNRIERANNTFQGTGEVYFFNESLQSGDLEKIDRMTYDTSTDEFVAIEWNQGNYLYYMDPVYEGAGGAGGGGGGGGGSAGEDATDPDLYEQTFELFPHNSGFNPQTSDVELRYRVDADDVRVTGGYLEAGSWIFDAADGFDYRNLATVRIFDGTTYKITVVDRGNDPAIEGNKYWVRTGYVADRDEGIVELHIRTSGTSGTTATVGGGGVGDDGDFTYTPPGDSQLDLPDINDTSTEPYLETGLFTFPDGSQCVGIRYYDPTGETTEIDYDFTFDGQTYSDTVDIDGSVGYYEECIDPVAAGAGDLSSTSDLPDGEVGLEIVRAGSFYNGSLLFGESGSSFDFDDDTTSSGGLLGPPASGGGSGGLFPSIPWWWWLLLLILAYYFREDIKKTVDNIGRRFR